MTYKINGRAMARRMNQQTKKTIEAHHLHPRLAVMVSAKDKGNVLYARMKARKAQQLGIDCRTYHLPGDINQTQVLKRLRALNHDSDLTGIIVQLPLPAGIDENVVAERIDPAKDVDGMNPFNIGRLASGVRRQRHFYPVGCTPAGVMTMLRHYGEHDSEFSSLSGKRVLIIGRSNIVGLPLDLMMIRAGAEVTIVNHHAKAEAVDFPGGTKRSPFDIVISSAGQPDLITHSDDHQILIDVSENKNSAGQLCGDFSSTAQRQSRAYSPVPGGCGPMTIAELMHQVVECEKQK